MFPAEKRGSGLDGGLYALGEREKLPAKKSLLVEMIQLIHEDLEPVRRESGQDNDDHGSSASSEGDINSGEDLPETNEEEGGGS